jgi:hypothetical protein
VEDRWRRSGHAREHDLRPDGDSWHFNPEYEGNPITVSMAGKLTEDGDKMSGTMYVDPMQVDGTFAAVKLPDVAPTMQ